MRLELRLFPCLEIGLDDVDIEIVSVDVIAALGQGIEVMALDVIESHDIILVAVQIHI